MPVPLPPRKRARSRRRPQGQPRLLLDCRWEGEERGWLVSAEWYVDDLAKTPDGIEVFPYRPSLLGILDRLGQCLAALQKRAQPPFGGETLDLRDPGAR